LHSLYLEPLQRWLAEHGGVFARDTAARLHLVIDIKTRRTHSDSLRAQLQALYPAALGTGRVLVSFTGCVQGQGLRASRYANENLTDCAPLAGPAPQTREQNMASLNWRRHLNWRGKGALPLADSLRLVALADSCPHRPVRLYAAPDHPTAWASLARCRVPIVNTDHPQRYARWSREQ
jgi:hypothetical protein